MGANPIEVTLVSSASALVPTTWPSRPPPPWQVVVMLPGSSCTAWRDWHVGVLPLQGLASAPHSLCAASASP